METIHIGTSGYNYRDWKGTFYPSDIPQKKWFSYYTRHFSTVEINGSFYKNLLPKTYHSWYRESPDTFQFVIKGSRLITHLKKLHDIEEVTNNFFDHAKELREKLKIIIWQFPKSFQQTNENSTRLEKFLYILPQEIKHVFEFRDESWFTESIFARLEKYHAGFVINDTPAFGCFEAVTSDIVYIRFHGPGKLYVSSYSDEELQKWAMKIKKYAEKYDVYVYFNNTMNGIGVENAKTLMTYVDL